MSRILNITFNDQNQPTFKMNTKNLLINIAAIVLTFGSMMLGIYFYENIFAASMTFIGGWQVGAWLRDFTRRFPLHPK